METVAPFKEVIDEIKDAGGEAFRFCFQCGLCDAVCPWNKVRPFSIRRIIREATFGLTGMTSGAAPPAADARRAVPGGSSRSKWACRFAG